jgi:putative hydrolase of the HAD superfamily
LPRIEAITFDAGGTLITPHPSVGSIYAQEASRHGLPDLSPELLDKRFLAAWQAEGGRAESRGDWAAIVGRTFEGLGSVADPTSLFESLYDRFTEASAWHIYPDVLPTLQQLTARGLRLGVISNWDDRLRPLLDRLRLSRHFEVIIVSCELGHRKPDPIIFQRAAKDFQLSPDRLLHVGDRWEQDVQGARRAGLESLGICRGSKKPSLDWVDDLQKLTSIP